MLVPLPDLVFPITKHQFDPLMDGVVQLNTIDGAITEKQQRGLSLYFHTYDLWIKSGGQIDYRGKEGHARLMQDAMTFCGTGNPVVTRHGDLQAAHLAIDYSDAQMRLKEHNQSMLPNKVADLLVQCTDLCEYPPETEKRVALLMDMLGKRRMLP